MFLISIIPKYMANPLYAVPLYGLWLCRNVSIGRGKSSNVNVFAYYFNVMCEIYIVGHIYGQYLVYGSVFPRGVKHTG